MHSLWCRHRASIFVLSEPIDADSVEATKIQALSETEGLLVGNVSYDTQNWWLIWTPRETCPPATGST